MPSKANGTPLMAHPSAATVPAVATADMTAQQRSARVDQLVVEVAELKAKLAAESDFSAYVNQKAEAAHERLGELSMPTLKEHLALMARVRELETSRTRTFWQRLRWLVRG